MGPIVFFDGVCNLCNWSVDFILKRDPKKIFRFVSLQSKVASDLLEMEGVHAHNMRTIILLKNGKTFYQSNAILEIVRQLTAPWPLLYVFKLVPRFVRDGLYNLVSKNRYSWFGKRDTCRIPSIDERGQFLEDVSKVSMI